MLPFLVEFGWKSALIAGAALLADRAMRGRPAAERVFVLRMAVLLLLALPFAMLLLPPVDLAWLPAPAAPVEVVETAAVSATPSVSAPPSPGAEIDFALFLYLIGAGAVMLHLALGIAILHRWTRRAVPVSGPAWQAALVRVTAPLRRPIRLLVSGEIATPISWGIAPAWILIDPATLERPAQAEAVLAHEVAHIRRFDWPMLVAARIAVAPLWFNPLVWLLCRTLARRGETAADEAAVRRIERADYAEALLTFATAPATRAAATGMALWPNALAERIAHIAVHRHRRGSRFIPAAALACVAVAAPPLAAAKLVQAVPGSVRDSQRLPGRVALVPGHATSSTMPRLTATGTRGQPDTEVAAIEPVATVQRRASEVGRAQAVPMPQPVVQVVAVPQVVAAPGSTSIIGRDGSIVSASPNGTSIIAGRPETQPSQDLPADVRRAIEEGARAAEQGARAAVQGRWNAAQSMRVSAAGLRETAANFERSMGDPGLPQDTLNSYRNAARSMREQAAKLEAQANELSGS